MNRTGDRFSDGLFDGYFLLKGVPFLVCFEKRLKVL